MHTERQTAFACFYIYGEVIPSCSIVDTEKNFFLFFIEAQDAINQPLPFGQLLDQLAGDVIQI